MLSAKHGGRMSRWLEYIAQERDDKRKRLYALTSGIVQLSMTTEGIRRDITQETVDKLTANIAEIEQILTEEGYTVPDA